MVWRGSHVHTADGPYTLEGQDTLAEAVWTSHWPTTPTPGMNKLPYRVWVLIWNSCLWEPLLFYFSFLPAVSPVSTDGSCGTILKWLSFLSGRVNIRPEWSLKQGGCPVLYCLSNWTCSWTQALPMPSFCFCPDLNFILNSVWIWLDSSGLVYSVLLIWNLHLFFPHTLG